VLDGPVGEFRLCEYCESRRAAKPDSIICWGCLYNNEYITKLEAEIIKLRKSIKSSQGDEV